MTRLGVLFERTPEAVWVATCPSVAGAVAQGRTIPECRRKLRDAVASLLAYAPSGDLEDLLESEATGVRAELLDFPAPERSDEDLLSQADIARTAHVSRQAVHQWVGRPDFPRSVESAAAGRLWRRNDVLRWLASGRKTAGRPSVKDAWPPSALFRG